MSSAIDALPILFPFIGAVFVSMSVGFCCMNRRIRTLSDRLYMLEVKAQAPPQILERSSPPPIPLQPPIYTYPTQPQYTYPYYQQPPPPSAPSGIYNQGTI
jgi:hypothetical protein